MNKPFWDVLRIEKMDSKIEKIYLSLEALNYDSINFQDDHTDVIILFGNGSYYSASFFTFQNIWTLKEQNRQNGTFLKGSYFWVEGMILIDDLAINTVKKVINELLEEGDFERAFKKL